MNILSHVYRDKYPTAAALFGVAALQALIGALGWFLYSERPDFGTLGWVVTHSGAFYLVLGLLARWFRLPSALIGAALYAAILSAQALQSIQVLMSGLIIKIPVTVLLGIAVMSAAARGSSEPASHPKKTS